MTSPRKPTKNCNSLLPLRLPKMQIAAMATATKKKTRRRLIGNKNDRKHTFRMRKSCLVKKVGELSALCDVQAAMIIHRPNEHGIQAWPSKETVSSLLREVPRHAVARAKEARDQSGGLPPSAKSTC
nr:MADS-box transcription factor [Spirodela polyrhiza]